MSPYGPYNEIDRTVIALGFLAEVRQAQELRPADCTLTSCDREELRRRASNGDEDAFAELTRRREPEPVAA